MYASDITRTFPVAGKFTAPQRDLYEAVLNAQKACIKKCKIEDQVSLNELHRASTSSCFFCLVGLISRLCDVE
jgi:intermediate cleaving peptidase 55